MYDEKQNLVNKNLRYQNDLKLINDYLRDGFGKATYDRWLSSTKIDIDTNRNVVILKVSTEFIKNIIIQSYFREISAFVYKNCKTAKKIEVIVEHGEIIVKKTSSLQPITETTTNNFKFEDFVCGTSNKLAYHSAKQASDMIVSKIFSNTMLPCLCIYGPVGIGKTHLLKSIVSQVKSLDKNCNIAYFSAEKFKQKYIESVRQQKLFEFKEFFSSLDALIIDDIQFICTSKSSVTDEFSRVLDALLENRKWVIIACDRQPNNLPINQRTVSRLASGFSIGIDKPDFDLRFNILQSKINKLTIDEAGVISTAILQHIANSVLSSIRELEATLYRVVTYAKVMQLDQLQDNMLHTIIGKRAEVIDVTNGNNNSTSNNFDEILLDICEKYDVSQNDVIGKSRVSKISKARAAVVLLARKRTGLTLSQIGEKLGNRSHATISHLLKKY